MDHKLGAWVPVSARPSPHDRHGPHGYRLQHRQRRAGRRRLGTEIIMTDLEYREFNMIMVPTRRQVYVRSPDGSPVRDMPAVEIGFADVTCS